MRQLNFCIGVLTCIGCAVIFFIAGVAYEKQTAIKYEPVAVTVQHNRVRTQWPISWNDQQKEFLIMNGHADAAAKLGGTEWMNAGNGVVELSLFRRVLPKAGNK